MAQQENRRLNLELQEAKDRQEEQSAQAQRLKDKVAQMKDTLGQAQQRVVSETPGQQEVENVTRAGCKQIGGKAWLKTKEPSPEVLMQWGTGKPSCLPGSTDDSWEP